MGRRSLVAGDNAVDRSAAWGTALAKSTGITDDYADVIKGIIHPKVRVIIGWGIGWGTGEFKESGTYHCYREQVR